MVRPDARQSIRRSRQSSAASSSGTRRALPGRLHSRPSPYRRRRQPVARHSSCAADLSGAPSMQPVPRGATASGWPDPGWPNTSYGRARPGCGLRRSTVRRASHWPASVRAASPTGRNNSYSRPPPRRTSAPVPGPGNTGRYHGPGRPCVRLPGRAGTRARMPPHLPPPQAAPAPHCALRPIGHRILAPADSHHHDRHFPDVRKPTRAIPVRSRASVVASSPRQAVSMHRARPGVRKFLPSGRTACRAAGRASPSIAGKWCRSICRCPSALAPSDSGC